MSDYQWALQQALYTALTGASPAIAGGRVYDHVPQDATFPFVMIAAPQGIPDDTSTDTGISTTYDLHTYSRYRGQKETLQLISQIYDELHGQSLTVTGRTSAHSWVRSDRTFEEPDGLTMRGVVEVEIVHR